MKKKQFQLESEDIFHDSLCVQKILFAAAHKFDLFDNTVTSRMPNTINSFSEREHFGFGLGARIADKLILIDFNPRGGMSEKLNNIIQCIKTELLHAFPGKVKEICEGNAEYYKI